MPQNTERTRPSPILRLGAIVLALALPVAWLLSLRSDPDFMRANAVRLAGGILGAAAAWLRAPGAGTRPGWHSFVAGGIVGSLAATVLSLMLPWLGPATASGWLVSGALGGAAVALTTWSVAGVRTP